MSVFQFREKGPLMNNAALFTTKSEREKMDKRPHYRQSAIVFALLGILFALMALQTLLKTGWLIYAVWAVALVTVVYAVASSVKIERNTHRR